MAQHIDRLNALAVSRTKKPGLYAADQDHAFAQENLREMYSNGQGVPQDYIQAHMWWNLAAAQGGRSMPPSNAK